MMVCDYTLGAINPLEFEPKRPAGSWAWNGENRVPGKVGGAQIRSSSFEMRP